jgi:hypothetical protein
MPFIRPGINTPGTSLSLGANNFRADISGDAANTDPALVVVSGTTAGSNRVIFVGGGFAEMADPTHSIAGTITKRGTDQGFAGGLWPGFGWRAYTTPNAASGGSYTVSVDKDNAFPLGEISISVLECIGGSSFVQSQGNVAGAGAGVGYSSPSITVTGPAVIYALWSGDGDTPVNPKDVAVSGTGWSLLQTAFISNTSYVQFAVASRIVSSAGSYSCTWTPVTNQGAVMHMVAVVLVEHLQVVQ